MGGDETHKTNQFINIKANKVQPHKSDALASVHMVCDCYKETVCLDLQKQPT
eukprot:m.378965 g.378965  ORF g.378965 m.378965 type:complete len:52 (+) comp96171_c0_seq1:18-173(+)